MRASLPLLHLVVFSVAKRRVADNLSSADDLTQGEETNTLDNVDTKLESSLSVVGTKRLESVLDDSALVWSSQHSGDALVHGLELSLGWRSHTLSFVDGLAELSTDLAPVNGEVGQLTGLGDGRVDESCDLVNDGRHYVWWVGSLKVEYFRQPMSAINLLCAGYNEISGF